MCRTRGSPIIEIPERSAAVVVNAKSARNVSHAPGALKTGWFHLEASTFTAEKLTEVAAALYAVDKMKKMNTTMIAVAAKAQ
jgi:hypothetical protein